MNTFLIVIFGWFVMTLITRYALLKLWPPVNEEQMGWLRLSSIIFMPFCWIAILGKIIIMIYRAVEKFAKL